MRRPAPRPLQTALTAAMHQATPPTTLARVQAAWDEAAGAQVAQESEPVAEREGVVTVACRSAVWAQELELLGGEIVARLNGLLGAEGGSAPVRRLRFKTVSGGRS
jgi:hypothetical protein